jgi:hypothetical protein
LIEREDLEEDPGSLTRRGAVFVDGQLTATNA